MTQEVEPITTLGDAPAISPLVAVTSVRRQRKFSRLVQHGKLWTVLFCLMSFTIVGVVLFIFIPQYGAIKYSFYNWDGGIMVEEVRGLGNYAEAFFHDKLFWPTFQLVLILLAANAVKMWPSIFTAIVLHRLRSERWQYVYRVIFVIPLIIPAIVGLLVWKSFFDPQLGPLNKVLRITGLLDVLRHLDVIMPAMASRLAPMMVAVVDPLLYTVWGLLWAGAVILTVAKTNSLRRSWLLWLLLALTGYFLLGGGIEGINAQAAFRFTICIAGAVATFILRRRFSSTTALLRWLGYVTILAASLLVLFGKIWTMRTHDFDSDTPAWLSRSHLIIPSLIFWGFPWVGTIGVLIYLAGLQNITQDVYEAAELDGVGSIGRLFQIELPLIMTQVRINLILMTIGTLTDYGLVLLLLGPDGGAGGVGTTPGLYMYRTAFVDGRLGYACALGMVLFVIIMGITIFYQRYVVVEK